MVTKIKSITSFTTIKTKTKTKETTKHAASYHSNQQFHSQNFIQENEKVYLHKNLKTNVYSSFIHIVQKWEQPRRPSTSECLKCGQ